MFRVRPLGTITVLLLATTRELMTVDEFKEFLDGLLSSGFWLTVDVYNMALEEVRSMEKRND